MSKFKLGERIVAYSTCEPFVGVIMIIMDEDNNLFVSDKNSRLQGFWFHEKQCRKLPGLKVGNRVRVKRKGIMSFKGEITNIIDDKIFVREDGFYSNHDDCPFYIYECVKLVKKKEIKDSAPESFNLERALAGEPVMTICEEKVELWKCLSESEMLSDVDRGWPVIGRIVNEALPCYSMKRWTKNGKIDSNNLESNFDLVMAPKKEINPQFLIGQRVQVIGSDQVICAKIIRVPENDKKCYEVQCEKTGYFYYPFRHEIREIESIKEEKTYWANVYLGPLGGQIIVGGVTYSSEQYAKESISSKEAYIKTISFEI